MAIPTIPIPLTEEEKRALASLFERGVTAYKLKVGNNTRLFLVNPARRAKRTEVTDTAQNRAEREAK